MAEEERKALEIRVKQLEDRVAALQAGTPGAPATAFGVCTPCTVCHVCHMCNVCNVCLCNVCHPCVPCSPCSVCGPCSPNVCASVMNVCQPGPEQAGPSGTGQ
jgi:hypothetical protein